jgi:hypothetical protein
MVAGSPSFVGIRKVPHSVIPHCLCTDGDGCMISVINILVINFLFDLCVC